MPIRIAGWCAPVIGGVRVATAVAVIAVIGTTTPTPAFAQFARLSAAAEAGVAVGATHTLAASSYRSALPVLFRASLFERVTPWSVDMDIELRNRRVVGGAVMNEVGNSATLLHVLSRSVDDDAWMRRPYVGLGYSYITLSPTPGRDRGRFQGVRFVLGKRIAVSKLGVLRPELSWTHDWRVRTYAPSSAGVSRFALRVGISATNPTTW